MASGYPAVPTTGEKPLILEDAAKASWVGRIAQRLNAMLAGKFNCTLDITLTANAASTTIIDARIAAYSAVLLEPMTANAASALYETPYVLVSSQQSGQAVFAHANDANSDKTFRMVILGG